jgi:exodeoxyribonuclease V alpha subunit
MNQDLSNIMRMPVSAVAPHLEKWAETGWLRQLDLELARFICDHLDSDDFHRPDPGRLDTRRQERAHEGLIFLSVALVSLYAGQGHVCLDLAKCLENPTDVLRSPVNPASQQLAPDFIPDLSALLAGLRLQDWVDALSMTSLSSPNTAGSPLVLSQTDPARPLLYLRRMWRYEQDIMAGIQHRLTRRKTESTASSMIRPILDSLFHDNSTNQLAGQSESPDWQKIACALALHNPFAIITGGPGTGKTTTVVRLLSALTQLHTGTEAIRIKLAAPTGKAAVRLSESINAQRSRLENGQSIPARVTTIHQLLGPKAGSREFKYHASHPLPADVVVIDEASMVDVEMMARLITALSPQCRLILLGDKDQLASVEAGAVLGSLCQRARQVHYQPETATWIEQASGQLIPDHDIDPAGLALDQAITMLRFSHRFGQIPGIGELAARVNEGDTSALSCFNGDYPELSRFVVNRETQDSTLASLATDTVQGFGHYLRIMNEMPTTDSPREIDAWAHNVLTAYSRFQLLAVLRQGPTGVSGLNARIETHLAERGLIQRLHPDSSGNTSRWYAGRPVMMTRNDYSLGLMNGDIGIALWHPATVHAPARLRVAFADPAREQGIHWVSPNRLPHVETVFAMTVHKSQGSEFSHTALILPGSDNPVMTRELVYTAITRASERFTLIDRDNGTFERAILRRVMRLGNLSASTCSPTDDD